MTGGPRRAALALVAALALASLAVRDAWPPDETRYADVARAMLAGEGVVVPRLHDAPYGEKPPVFFWLGAAVAAAGAPLGAAPRIVSALAALLVLGLLPGIGRRLGLTAEVAGRAPLVLATSPLFLAYALAGLLDATATAWVVLAVAAQLARFDAPRSRRIALALFEGCVLAAALLTKGPVLLLFPLGLRAGAWLALRRSVSDSRCSAAAPTRFDGLAFGVAIALATAWLAAAAQDAGVDYVRSITLGQAVSRVTGAAPHLRPPGFLLLVTFAGLLPWAPFVVLALRDGLRDWRAPRDRALAASGLPIDACFALAGWLLVPVVLLSFLRTQQPHYGLPGLPAAALLATAALERSASRARAVPFAVGVAVLAAGMLPLLTHLDRTQSPRALLALPAIRDAARLESPGSLRSAVRVLGGPTQVDELAEASVVARLRAEPDRVALVWERDLSRLGDRMGVEEVARGYARGREIVALRARREERSLSLPPASP